MHHFASLLEEANWHTIESCKVVAPFLKVDTLLACEPSKHQDVRHMCTAGAFFGKIRPRQAGEM